MANYLELKNDNQNVVINDLYPIPSLIYRGNSLTDTQFNYGVYLIAFLYTHWDWYGGIILKDSPTIGGLGFDLPESEASLDIINKNLLTMYRTDAGVGCFAKASCRKKSDGTGYVLSISVESNTQNLSVEAAVYVLNPKILKASPIGGSFRDTDGKLVFDFMRGAMQIIGTMSGGVNPTQNIAATYNLEIPSGLDQSNVFITARSGLPFLYWYTMRPGGITQYFTAFEPVMTFSQNNLQIQLVSQKPINNVSGSKSYGGFFENVGYVVQPKGVYI